MWTDNPEKGKTSVLAVLLSKVRLVVSSIESQKEKADT
jgi:hypothetical protein